jgi:NAD(P)-dependent dehydrogenase (short-subunit alcohol dehydrogenase family)
VFYRQVDVTDAPAVAQFVDEAVRKFGGIDVCIGNAGIVQRGRLTDLPIEAWRRTLDVNLTGCFLVAQAAARAMIRIGHGGHVVLISSWVQDVPREGIGAYCASKSGLKMLAKCLALELGPSNIRVNLVAPGFVDAGLTGQNLKEHPELRTGMEASIPLGRLISAQELAQTVRLLCADAARYVTGATLLVDGGSSLFFRKHD